MDNFKRIDTNLIAPFFLERCRELVSICSKLGKDYYAISGYRDPLEQERLYAIGRTIDLDKPIVTRAKPYRSLHNFGLAIDFCLDADTERSGLQPSWKLEDYRILAEEALKLDLSAAFYWKSFAEGPHIQWKSALLPRDMELIYKDSGLEAVWSEALKNV